MEGGGGGALFGMGTRTCCGLVRGRTVSRFAAFAYKSAF